MTHAAFREKLPLRKKSGFTCNFVVPTSDFTGFGRKPRLDSTSCHLDGKTPAVSRASAEAASAISNIFSFQNTCVGSGKRKGPRLWLRSLSVPPDIYGATAPTRYPTFFPQPRAERALRSVSQRRVALLFSTNSFCLGTSRLRGGPALKARHLRMLGYDAILVRRP